MDAEVGPTGEKTCEISVHLESDIASRNQNIMCLTEDSSPLHVPHIIIPADFLEIFCARQLLF